MRNKKMQKKIYLFWNKFDYSYKFPTMSLFEKLF